jgi:hypothetical protein
MYAIGALRDVQSQEDGYTYVQLQFSVKELRSIRARELDKPSPCDVGQE